MWKICQRVRTLLFSELLTFLSVSFLYGRLDPVGLTLTLLCIVNPGLCKVSSSWFESYLIKKYGCEKIQFELVSGATSQVISNVNISFTELTLS